MEGYQKSVIDVRIKFDKERERQFRDWLDKEYNFKRKSLPDGESTTINHLLAIKPSNLSRYLDEDFEKREMEINKFRHVSLNAIASPLLTQALVKKTTEKLATVDISIKEKWKPIDRFRWTARIVFVLVSTAIRWRRYNDSKKHRKYSTSRKASKARALKTRNSMASKSEVLFDMADFSKYEGRVPFDLQETLTKSPERRSDAELIRVQKFCRGLGVLSNFPVNRELDASRLIGYERYDKGRVMCLQGRLPQRFYHILAGRVSKIRSITLTNGIEKKYYGELYKGQTTDAEELQSHKRRDCTLVCTSNVEVLLFEKEDFMELLNSKNNQESNTSSFLSSIDIFRTFPIEDLDEESDAVITKYYPKDAIIVSNMKESEHLYVIKTGICKILRKFFITDDGVPVKLPRLASLQKIGETKRDNSAGSGLDYDETLEEAKRLRYDAKALLHELEPGEERPSRHSRIGRRRSRKSVNIQEINDSSFLQQGQELTNANSKDAVRKHSSNLSAAGTFPEEDALKLPVIPTGNLSTRVTRSQVNTSEGGSSSESQAPLCHSLLHLGSLKSGDVYGIESILHRALSMVQSSVPMNVSLSQPDVTNLILLSEGAECVLIKKNSFLHKADFCTLAKIVSSTHNGLSNEREVMGVDRERAWKHYKEKTVSKLVRKKKLTQTSSGR